MMVYKVEIYLDAVSGYDNHTKFDPDYVMVVKKVRKRFWFPWPKIEIGIIKNLRPAEMVAWKRALNHAKILKKKSKVRIVRVTEVGGKKESKTVWDNGHLIDTKLATWPQWCARLLVRRIKWALLENRHMGRNTTSSKS
jgi:hypothetical protein